MTKKNSRLERWTKEASIINGVQVRHLRSSKKCRDISMLLHEEPATGENTVGRRNRNEERSIVMVDDPTITIEEYVEHMTRMVCKNSPAMDEGKRDGAGKDH